MAQNISAYINEISEKYRTGRAGEHAYRPTFEKLIKSLDQKLSITNDPKRTEHGAPDFIFVRGDLIAGYAETKDVDADLDKVEKSEQLERYLGYSNLILTNYLEFRFFRNGERYGEPIIIGKILDGEIYIQDMQASLLEDALTDFLAANPEQIKSGARLAKIMGGKARRIRDNVNKFLSMEAEKSSELFRVYEVVKKLLVHDLTKESFADMYAQTLVYGLFVARYHDKTPENFTRQEARDLIPASNPFLASFFDHIAGQSFDKRLAYIVNELCAVFSCADVNQLLHQYFKKDEDDEGPDPIIHFYEDFLKEYDSEQRKKLGAFYTPLPVVRFIVRAVDSILEKDFGLPQGFADTTKTSIRIKVQADKINQEVHRVQILDPAAGTGTFLNEVIKLIYARFSDQTGRWNAYVNDDLLPRLYGFELMMTPYTIAHLKLGMTLRETGHGEFNKRLGVYLANSLEEGVRIGDDLFSSIGLVDTISREADAAARIKNEKPIMVVIGNPPYSISSSNKGEWIQNLIKDYKKDLGERKINLDDDYIKFIRFAEHFIEKNKNGIVAMITNNSFIDGVTHRQMRKHLLETFDDIYILDLHGNSKKKEKAPDGGKDENVFDIQQGVSISIFVRNAGTKKGLGNVYHAEFYGKREDKFKALNDGNIQNVKWKKLDYSEPYYFFVPKDFAQESEYGKGFSVDALFPTGSSGIETLKDALVINNDKSVLEKILFDIQRGDCSKYESVVRKSAIEKCLRDKGLQSAFITKLFYRPFDYRYIIYSKTAGGILHRPRYEVMQHLLKPNLALGFSRTVYGNFDWQDVIVTDAVAEKGFMAMRIGNAAKVYPLYCYAEDGLKVPNFKKEIIDEIEKISGKVSPEDVFDYIYAVLHSPSYRERYKEFLKIDFPRVPYPKDVKSFKRLVALGGELRVLHLLESQKLNKFITTYSISGSNIIEKVVYENSKVFINNTQYFGGVPDLAWNFYVGGYQPAQKWLKDRKGRTLTSDEIDHYQKMIVALAETDRIMKEIDK